MKGRCTYLLFILIFSSLSMQAQKHEAYRLYNSEGKKIKYSKVLKSLKEADVFFFGEEHNNPIAHWLQLKMTQDLYELRDNQLVLGAEMFESDNQVQLNEYLKDLISEKSFKKETRLWNNYSTDYKPLLEFAKEHQLDFIATNVPRRYASTTYHNGIETLDELSEEAKKFIAPLPITVDLELESYKAMLHMMESHDDPNFPKSQAVKDATMGYFITQNLKPNSLFIHYNGSYHSNNYEGTVWYVNHYKSGLKIKTLTTVSQEDITKVEEENLGKADFILVVPSDMTKTY